MKTNYMNQTNLTFFFSVLAIEKQQKSLFKKFLNLFLGKYIAC
jgi:hypothetical protein